jgi:hypothetical protein
MGVLCDSLYFWGLKFSIIKNKNERTHKEWAGSLPEGT